MKSNLSFLALKTKGFTFETKISSLKENQMLLV